MWIQQIALMIACLGILVLSFSWFFFQDEWSASSFIEDWVLLEGDIVSLRQFEDATIVTMVQNRTISIWIPKNISINDSISIIAKKSQDSYEAIKVIS